MNIQPKELTLEDILYTLILPENPGQNWVLLPSLNDELRFNLEFHPEDPEDIKHLQPLDFLVQMLKHIPLIYYQGEMFTKESIILLKTLELKGFSMSIKSMVDNQYLFKSTFIREWITSINDFILVDPLDFSLLNEQKNLMISYIPIVDLEFSYEHKGTEQNKTTFITIKTKEL